MHYTDVNMSCVWNRAVFLCVFSLSLFVTPLITSSFDSLCLHHQPFFRLAPPLPSLLILPSLTVFLIHSFICHHQPHLSPSIPLSVQLSKRVPILGSWQHPPDSHQPPRGIWTAENCDGYLPKTVWHPLSVLWVLFDGLHLYDFHVGACVSQIEQGNCVGLQRDFFNITMSWDLNRF